MEANKSVLTILCFTDGSLFSHMSLNPSDYSMDESAFIQQLSDKYECNAEADTLQLRISPSLEHKVFITSSRLAELDTNSVIKSLVSKVADIASSKGWHGLESAGQVYVNNIYTDDDAVDIATSPNTNQFYV